jgi:flavin reductase (DIM6/NTAB) family NADH-FMN oxidoreductase RutF
VKHGSESPLEPSPEVADTKLLRKAFGAFATGVTIVTVGGPHPHGMTANSFTSVSLEPPLVLVCVGQAAHLHRSLSASEYFGISVLAARQEPVARHFANRSRTLGAAEFDSVDWLSGRLTGVPLIAGALAGFECQMWQAHDGGDHTIFTGRLLSMDRQPDDDGLLFFNGQFRSLSPIPTEVRA